MPSFSGRITKVSADGRSAVVSLDHEVEGMTLAVIGPDTTGRVRLMNGIGRLDANLHVVGEAVPGPDSMRVTRVAAG